MTNTEMRIPSFVLAATARLRAIGQECYPVGGCVRDLLRGREPQDWDLCTSALPEETLKAMQGYPCFTVGASHGTVGVLIDGQMLEITTFRVDGDYKDGRHPQGVRFTPDLREDLARRDFTINAMALSAAGEVIDPFGGQEDLQNGVIRCVGDPSERLREDSLRVMRALRFSATLGFSAEARTAAAIREARDGLCRVARERILSEWKKLLAGAGAARVLAEFPEVIGAAFPEARGACSDRSRMDAAILRMETARDASARWARLWFGLGLGENQLKDEPLSAEERDVMRFLLEREQDAVPSVSEVRGWLRRHGERGLRLGALLWEGKDGAAEAISELKRIRDEKLCFTARGPYGLVVSGDEVAACTGARGRQIGQILELLVDAVVGGEVVNEREALLRELEKRGQTLLKELAEKTP